MRIKLYTRRIENYNGKDKLYRDMAANGFDESIESAHIHAEKIYKSWMEISEKEGKNKYFVGINFKIKDLDTKQVIETFEMRF